MTPRVSKQSSRDKLSLSSMGEQTVRKTTSKPSLKAAPTSPPAPQATNNTISKQEPAETMRAVPQKALSQKAPTDTPSSDIEADTSSEQTDMPTDGTGVIRVDPWLEPYQDSIKYRFSQYQQIKSTIERQEGSLADFATGYNLYGFQRDAKSKSTIYREWAPNAVEASLIGDFNEWRLDANPLSKNAFGVWEGRIPDRKDGDCAIPHGSKVKVTFVTPSGERLYRVPAWIQRVEQNLAESPIYYGIFWNPPKSYKWQNKAPNKPESLRIYEAHVGICTPEAKCASYDEFRTRVLPRIAELGYNAIQLMAIMEHPYYASFGYQVTSFFAASSRFGTPDDLKRLIDDAHGFGLSVLLDLVHSHSASNTEDGINFFDGSDHLYFHGLPKGRHELWDSRLFNYGNYETLRFLLSNCRYWVEEFGFDGYRFDGVTSMMYHHHGIAYGFSGDYNEYFGMNTDIEAVNYLMLANDMLHELYPNMITIAEDVSGMPTLCRPVAEGGVGFDYRLAMAVPDMWIKLLKEFQDDEWNMGHIVHTLTNRRHAEKHIAYAESHDQALVGDKTLAFWLMDKEMYDFMTVLKPETPIIHRGMALHKMIRLITHGLAGEGYLNFIGNEFGHPEWLDFPREGNGNSFHYARRQFNLIDDELLRYKHLFAFDAAMQKTEQAHPWLAAPQAYVSLKNEGDKVIVFERGKGLVWVFNFHPNQSFTDYKIGVEEPGVYRIVLQSDRAEFGGHSRLDESVEYHTRNESWNHRANSMQVYIPSRTCIIFGRQSL